MAATEHFFAPSVKLATGRLPRGRTFGLRLAVLDRWITACLVERNAQGRTLMPFAIDELLCTLIKEALTQTLAVAKKGSGIVTTPPRLLNVAQAATHIGRTRAAVQHLASDKIPVVRIDRRVSIDVRIWTG